MTNLIEIILDKWKQEATCENGYADAYPDGVVEPAVVDVPSGGKVREGICIL